MFTTDANGLDLLAADGNTESAGWAAVVTTASYCDAFPEIALHEFGHLLGAGHYEPNITPPLWLYSDSLAFAYAEYLGYPVNMWIAVRSVMTRPNIDMCALVPGGCSQTMTFSNSVGLRDNVKALSVTAQSVANYRTGSGSGGGGGGDGGCTLQAPTGPITGIFDSCVYGFSLYTILWNDSCRGCKSNCVTAMG